MVEPSVSTIEAVQEEAADVKAQTRFDKFLAKFRKSKGIPEDVTDQIVRQYYDETLIYISVPDYEHRHLVNASDDMKIKVIKIGVANCWVRDKLIGHGYSQEEITKVQKELGSEMFFSLTPMWKIATSRVAKQSEANAKLKN